MEEKIIGIISSISKVPETDLAANKDADNLWESISHIEIVMGLEEEFNIQFTEDEIAQMRTVKKIIDTVESKS